MKSQSFKQVLENYAARYELTKMNYSPAHQRDLTEAKPAGTSASTSAGTSAGTSAASPNALKILTTDRPEVQVIKNCIINKTPKDAFDAIDAKAKELATTPTTPKLNFSVKIGEEELKVVLTNAGPQPDGKLGIRPDYDSTAKLIEGMDLDYITGQLKKGSDKTFLGIDFGTDEEKLASVAGAIYSYCYDKKANAKDVLQAIGVRYQERYGESMLGMIDGEFTGSPDVFARAVFGEQISEGDISTALGVDFAQSLLVDVSLMIGSYALTFFSAGAGTPAAVATTGRFANAMKNVFTLGRAGREVKNLRTGVAAGEEALAAAKLTYKSKNVAGLVSSAEKLKNVGSSISLAKNELEVLKGVKNFSAIEKFITIDKSGRAFLNGANMSAAMAADAPTFFQSLKTMATTAPTAVKTLLSKVDPATAAMVVGAASLPFDAIPDGIAAASGSSSPYDAGSATLDENTLTTFCDEIYKMAKGYTGGDDELKIAFAMLSLNKDTWEKVNATWAKNYGDDGSLYKYCVDTELSGDLKVLVDGYLAGIGCSESPLFKDVANVKGNLEKSAIPAAPQAVTESAILSFKDFLKK